MLYEDYKQLVHPEKFTLNDYGKWVKFKDSFPPVGPQELSGTMIEVLSDESHNPSFESIFLIDGEVSFRDYDVNNEWLEWRMHDESYWRFIPDPPDDSCYNVG